MNNVNTNRLRLGDLITAVSGVILLVSPFLTWYTQSSSGAVGGAPTVSYNGRAALTYTDLILFLTAIVAIIIALLVITEMRPHFPINGGLIVLVLGVLSLLLVLLRLFKTPSGLFDDIQGIDVDLSAGPFVALIGALGVTLGGWIIWNYEGRRVSGRGGRRRTQPIPGPDEQSPPPRS